VTPGRTLALGLAAAAACLMGTVVTVLSTGAATSRGHGAAAVQAVAADLTRLGVILGVLGAMLALAALTARVRDVRASRPRALPAVTEEITVTAADLASSARSLTGLIESLRVRVHAGDD